MRYLLLVFTLFSTFAYGQLSDKHWLPPLHSRGITSSLDHYVYLSTPEPIPFGVVVTNGNGVPIAGSPFTISQNNPVSFYIGDEQPSLMLVEQSGLNMSSGDNGLVFEGSSEFYVTFKIVNANHGEIIVSKGKAGIGTDFRLGGLPQISDDNNGNRNFVSSFMATEDGTTVTVSDYNAGVTFTTATGTISDALQTFNLEAGESVVLSGYTDTSANLTGFIGARLESNKPIAVNTGNIIGGVIDGFNDINLDQIVPVEEVGTEYVFIKGNGSDNSERPLIIATEDNTQVFVGGIPSPYITLANAGDYVLVPTSYYSGVSNQNMRVLTDKPVYAYQILAGNIVSNVADRNTGLNFIPPLSCSFPRSVDLIPSLNMLDPTSNKTYPTDLFVLTTVDAEVSVNGTLTTALPATVIGNSNWVTYRITGYTDNVKVESTGPMSVGVFGSSGTVGYAGYYSGFGVDPEVELVEVCPEETVSLFDAIVSGDIPEGGTWSPALASGTDIFDATLDSTGVYTYTVSQTCGDLVLDITVSPLPIPVFTSITGNGSVCENEEAIFNVTASPNSSVEYTVNGGAVMILDIDATGTGIITISDLEAGDLTVSVTGISDAFCSNITTVTVSETIVVDGLLDPNLSFSYATPICPNEDYALPTVSSEFNSGGTYSSTAGLVIDSSTGEIDILSSDLGNHTVTYTYVADETDCINDGFDEFDVVIEASNTVSFNIQDFCLNASDIELPSSSLEGYTGTWYPSTVDTSTLGVYTYTFTPDSEFCAITTSFEINVSTCFIPEGISPNNDDINDNLDLSSFNVKKIKIFNRYGVEVYTKLDYEDEWHGQSNKGDKLPTGTYYYIIDFNDNIDSKIGWVYVNR
ncbi:gliding motility-associated C-terminal domain-containing protein [Winogradskyella undariae]|uniref:T9SS type B sorting domain-containing protein n=1 Tax=Winogradskyella undariae TaxID=1285465 RepID=UPI0015C76AEB|nr:gliding motility-associated C-terminal domain-containing protein [Winogradskyella undariae]